MKRSPSAPSPRSPPRLGAPSAAAFCGFYVAKADTRLFNQASQVALVRDDDDTVLTMANDFQGDPKEFALVVPVPTVLEKRPDPRRRPRSASSTSTPTRAPRLVEYFDPIPCAVPRWLARGPMAAVGPLRAADRRSRGARTSASPSRRSTRSASTTS